MSPCVIHNEKEKNERATQRGKHKQGRRGGQDETETQTTSRKGQSKGKKKKCWLCHNSSPPMVEEDVNSHAPVVRLKNLGPYHSTQHSNSIHGRLLGRELVILHIPSSVHSSSFHMPFSTPRASVFCLPQYPPTPTGLPGHHVTRNQAVPFLFFLQETGEHKQHSQ